MVFEKSFMFVYYGQLMLTGRRDKVLSFVKRNAESNIKVGR